MVHSFRSYKSTCISIAFQYVPKGIGSRQVLSETRTLQTWMMSIAEVTYSKKHSKDGTLKLILADVINTSTVAVRVIRYEARYSGKSTDIKMIMGSSQPQSST